MNRKKKTVGIIGFGRFGQLLAGLLRDDFDVAVSDRSDRSADAKRIGVSYVPVTESAGKDIVILCVPISEMEAVLEEIKPHLKKGALIMDTCSVKEYPIRVMQKLLPKDVEIIGTHPLFGPNSISDRKALTWALCQVRARLVCFAEWKGYLERKGFKVVVTDPATNDRGVAYAINLPNLIGRTFDKLGVLEQKISTLNFNRLLAIRHATMNDSEQLFRDSHKYNRFSSEVEKRFLKELKYLLKSVRK